MKLLKKFGLVLFSMMLFCGISVTAFASTPDIWTTAEVKGDNSSIVLKMKSKDGKKHNYSMYATYCDKRGKQIEQKSDVDEYEYRTKNKTVEWNDIRDWEKVKIMMFCDGKLVRDMVLKKDIMELDNGASIMCFSNEGNEIIARINFKSEEKHEYKINLRCYDKNNNVIDSYKDKRPNVTYGDAESGWHLLPDWKSAELDFVVDGERARLGLSR
ncbi:hypothetical protein IRP63_05480 [Clostridium botulinum]|uniref:Uncharacterized protein n=1 Tax=Clostridium botulinum C/D str. DC5 TaxID=1443128 RepID=A0A0A0IN60_CLOBO|nr:hypothetical protein [Clostridium botulinum]KGN00961.1 hypothetical protein Z955_02330 [Clostridium botulinum C/D str. DC5]KOC49323.1 hypothetical protein ADU89_15260 [Clostridium botulinum]KOC51571.1 hypothetical protein ADU90_15175 [Clostridium botulinum]MCD3235490.1 hypothetical protein [Clostridium botulinum D/C]MCD3241440.1 hypothetical protein [Clostridium botulinum D/C]